MEKDFRKNVLPKMKPSELIRLGLADMEKAEAAGFTIDMAKWHNTKFVEGEPVECAVCFAGGVMAGSLGVPVNHAAADAIGECRVGYNWREENEPPGNVRSEVEPEVFADQTTRNQLRALNYFRLGRVIDALDEMEYPRHDRETIRHLDAYGLNNRKEYDGNNPHIFRAFMQEMANRLEAIGY
jgi:hypothetical protein